MRIFAVYYHPVRGYEAVKNGFAWPGFFFTWIWAFAKGLHGIAIGLLFVSALSHALMISREMILILTGIMGVLVVALIVGFKGNRWTEKSLARKGYRLMEILRERSPDAAISKIFEETNIEKTIDIAIDKALERRESEGKSGGREGPSLH